MKLYELTDLYVGLLHQIEDGELELEEMDSALNVIQGEFNYKAENVVKMIKSLEYSIEAVKSEEKRLNEQRKRLEKNVDKLKDYLFVNMKRMNLNKINSDLFKISLKKNPLSVNIYDENAFLNIAKESYPNLIKEEVTIKVDKKGIKELLKDEEDTSIPGVKLTRTETVSIK